MKMSEGRSLTSRLIPIRTIEFPDRLAQDCAQILSAFLECRLLAAANACAILYLDAVEERTLTPSTMNVCLMKTQIRRNLLRDAFFTRHYPTLGKDLAG